MRIIKVIILLFVGSCLQTIARDFKEQSDSEPLKAPAVQWIGAITRSDAHIPEGRSFSGGKLKGEAKELWDAVDSLSRRSIIVGKSFKVRKSIQKAEVKICGLGFYVFSVNGQRVGESMFSPAWSDYDKTVWYNTYDVTEYLRNGKNDISVLLGNGFYNEQGGRYAKMRISFGPPTLYFDMTVTYDNGQKERLVSDATWQWRPSPITFNSIYGGEDYDARLENSGQWQPVVIQEAPKGVMRKQIAEPVKLMERYSVKETLRKDSVLVLDMGQNLSGFPEITVNGQAGQQLKLIPGETLTAEGFVNQRQTGCPHYYIYTLKGNGTEKWHPNFSYYGYRYIQVEGAIDVLKDIQSCFVYNSARKIGDFECSNQLFNDTYRIIDRAIRSNWQAVWTDCPHREKLGWLEQDWLNFEGLAYNYDCKSMIEQTMQQIVDAQHADGSMPEIAPEYTVFQGSWAQPFLESPEWGGALVALPMLYYRHYGDSSLIHRYYPAMKHYVDYLHTQDSCYILKQGLGDWYDYGEGRAGFSKNTPVPLVATAHYYQWTSWVQHFARITGRFFESGGLQYRCDQIREAFQRAFYNPQTHQYGTGSQASNAIPLVMRLVPEEEEKAVLANLISDIYNHGNRLTTGDVGNRYLFAALLENDLSELFYSMLNHDDVPGYGYQLKKGMTTLAEQWDPEQGASRNHFMMAHINNHLIKNIVGICISHGTVAMIAPTPMGDLKWARGSTEVNGQKVSVSWKIENGKFLMDTDCPTETHVRLPFSGDEMRIDAGKQHFEVNIK